MCGVDLKALHPLIGITIIALNGNSVKLIDLHDNNNMDGVPKNNVEHVLIVVSNVYRQFYEPAFSTYYGVSGVLWEFMLGRSRNLIPRIIEYCTHDS